MSPASDAEFRSYRWTCIRCVRDRGCCNTFSGCANCACHVREGLGAILAIAGEDTHIAILEEMDLQNIPTRLSNHVLYIMLLYTEPHG